MEYEGIVKEVFIPDSVDTLKTNKIGFKVYVYELDKEITVEGDTVKIYFHTDSSVVYWGFKCLVKASNTK